MINWIFKKKHIKSESILYWKIGNYSAFHWIFHTNNTELFTDDYDENMYEKKTGQHTVWISVRKQSQTKATLKHKKMPVIRKQVSDKTKKPLS